MRVRNVAASAVVVLGVLVVPGQSLAFAADPVMAAATTPLPSYIPLSPARLLDTRAAGPTIDGTGSGGGAIPGGQVRHLPVGGRGGVAPDAMAVALNVTATEGDAGTVLTVFPTGTPRPIASNLNLLARETAANMVVAKLGADGQIDIHNEVGNIHVIVDVLGYFPLGSTFSATAPQRFLDTRPTGAGQTIDGTFGGTGAVGQDATLDLQVGGRGGVPANASAVILNLTGTQSRPGTVVAAFPSGEPRPGVSNLNLQPGEDRPNLVVAKLGANGRVSLWNATDTVHLIADVVGWFPAGDTTYQALTPARLLDTRPTGVGQTAGGIFGGTGPIVAGAPMALPVTGRGGVPATGVGAVVLNITGTQASDPTHVTAWPSGEGQPAASTVNFNPGRDIANLAVVRVGPDGKVMLDNVRGSTHLVVDVMGWFPVIDSPVKSWGCPGWDRSACATMPVRAVPTDVLGFSPTNGPASVATGPAHSLAVLGSGGVLAWGDNSRGQLGSGTTLPSPTPIAVQGLGAGVTQVAAGDGISLALRADGSVATWGLAGPAPVPVTFPAGTAPMAQIFAAGTMAGAIGTDGSWWQWQDGQTAATQVATHGVKSLAAGSGHVVVLMADGGVFTAGRNDRGQLGNGTLVDKTDGFARVTGLGSGSGVVAVAAGGDASYALRIDGSVVAWGDNSAGQLGTGAASSAPVTAPVAVPALAAGSGVTALAAGSAHAVALKADGSVMAWGDNTKGQLGNPLVANAAWVPVPVSGLGAGSGVKAVVASGLHTIVLR